MVSRAQPAGARTSRRGPEERRGDPRTGNWLQAERRGMAIHWLVASLAAARPCTSDTLPRVIAETLASCKTRSPALRATLRRYGQTWLERFDPPSDWALLAAEVRADHVRLDLVWQDAAGGVWADELKTGAIARRTGPQIAAQIAACRGRYGPRFQGLRVVLLAVPAAVVIDRDEPPRGTWRLDLLRGSESYAKEAAVSA